MASQLPHGAHAGSPPSSSFTPARLPSPCFCGVPALTHGFHSGCLALGASMAGMAGSVVTVEYELQGDRRSSLLPLYMLTPLQTDKHHAQEGL
jgi:hypothetical protein